MNCVVVKEVLIVNQILSVYRISLILLFFTAKLKLKHMLIVELLK